MAEPRICSVDLCRKPEHCAGLCAQHYSRQKRHGDVHYTKHGEAVRWLEAHAHHEGDECLIWPMKRNKDGYAVIRALDRPGSMTAARMMCILAHGDPPDPSKYACHNCNNGHLGCVNPKHLRWDDNRGNQMDRVAAGNSNRGSRHGMSKLTESDVKQIRQLALTMPRADIAEKFSVSPSAIHLIMQGRTWGWMK